MHKYTFKRTANDLGTQPETPFEGVVLLILAKEDSRHSPSIIERRFYFYSGVVQFEPNHLKIAAEIFIAV